MSYRNNLDAAVAHISVLEKENRDLHKENEVLKKSKQKEPFPWKSLSKLAGKYLLYSIIVITGLGLLGWLPYKGIKGCINNNNIGLEVCKHKYPGGRGYRVWGDGGCGPMIRSCDFFIKRNNKWTQVSAIEIYEFDVEDYLKEKGKKNGDRPSSK